MLDNELFLLQLQHDERLIKPLHRAPIVKRSQSLFSFFPYSKYAFTPQ
jgi:hypothetical protein